MRKLTELDYAEQAKVKEVLCHSCRLAEMGLLRGVAVMPLFSGMTGGIRAYRINGSRVLALRDREADMIYVEVE